jgi:DNA replication and repair protein RecF
MHLQQLTLKNFRNIEEQILTFSARKNVLIGKNGQGKTNLLESLYFLSHARSNRTSTEREMLRTGASFAIITAELTPHHYEGRTLLEAQWVLSDNPALGIPRLKTVFKVNGNPVKSRSQLLGYLPTVSFFVSDLLLLRGTPEDRRKWLDAAIVQYDKRHFANLAQFQKVRHHKSRLLKEAHQSFEQGHFDIWNQQFAQAGAKVIQLRLLYLQLIQDLTAIKYLELSDGQESLSMGYRASYPLENAWDVPALEVLEEWLLTALKQAQREELRRGMCLVGPHRDDISFSLNGLDASAYASQGQQRTIVLALKLAELMLLSRKLTEPPILLLDDVMAELDPSRQQMLIEHLDPASQVFLTTTHIDEGLRPFLQGHVNMGFEPASIYQVQAGHFERESQEMVSSIDI